MTDKYFKRRKTNSLVEKKKKKEKAYADQHQATIATSGIGTTVANRHILLHNKGPCCLNPITA